MNNAEEIKKEFVESVDAYSGEATYPLGMQGAIIGTFEKACGGKDNRKLILKYLTGKTSSKDLHLSEWHALYKLTLPFKPEGGKWGSGNPELEAICNTLLYACLDQPGQTKMFEYPEFAGLSESSEDWESHVENPKVQEEDENPF